MTIQITPAQFKKIVSKARMNTDQSYMQALHECAKILGYRSFEALSAAEVGTPSVALSVEMLENQDLGFLAMALVATGHFWQISPSQAHMPVKISVCQDVTQELTRWMFGIDKLCEDVESGIILNEGHPLPLFLAEAPQLTDGFENIFPADIYGVELVDSAAYGRFVAFDNICDKGHYTATAHPFCTPVQAVLAHPHPLVTKVIQQLPELNLYRRRCIAHALECVNSQGTHHSLSIMPSQAIQDTLSELFMLLEGKKMFQTGSCMNASAKQLFSMYQAIVDSQ